jgi:ATP-dependent helicase/DNAse subunit B
MTSGEAQREIWLGPPLGEQRRRLIERCREMLRQGRGREMLYVAASRSLMLAVYEQLADGEEVKGVRTPLPLHLFNGLIQEILKTARLRRDDGRHPLPRRERIDLDARPLQRPLLAQIMAQLAAAGKIPHFGSLAISDGCVASVADLIGEIQRAGKTAGDFRRIVEERIRKSAESAPPPDARPNAAPTAPERVYGYERDIALIAECYQQSLSDNNLTEVNEDHLRTLNVLNGEYDGWPCVAPYLEPVKLLIVDGFFDFTPAQGEILKRLIARIPHVVFNFDYEPLNPSVFLPIEETIEHVESMADGFIRVSFHDGPSAERSVEVAPTASGFERLRFGLFNPDWPEMGEAVSQTIDDVSSPVFMLTAPDMEREIRKVAKLVKQHVNEDGISPDDIAVVVREKSAYAADIRRIFSDEGVAYSLDERLKVADIPAVRALRKLLDAAAARRASDEPGRAPHIPMEKLVGVFKSDYFAAATVAPDAETHPDVLENIAAFVGGQLHLDDWIKRAGRLLGKSLDGHETTAAHPSLPFSESVLDAPPEPDDELHETPDEAERPRVVVRPDAISPKQLENAVRVFSALGQILLKIPFEAPAASLAERLYAILEELRLEDGLKRALRAAQGDPERTLRATLDLRGFQTTARAVRAVRDAVAYAARGIRATLGEGNDAPPNISLSVFRDEVGRALEAQQIRVQPETFGAVRVLEVTDVRGLSFAIVFQLGMIEGAFPLRGRGDWIYPAAEREQLKEYGLTLEDISPATVRKEEHYFYQVVCRARERLYLSRPGADADEAETVDSYFLEEMRRVMPSLAVSEGERTLQAAKGYSGDFLLDATTSGELARASVAAERRRQDGVRNEELLAAEFSFSSDVLTAGEKVESVYQHAVKSGAIVGATLERLRIERIRSGGDFSEFDGRVGDGRLRQRLAGTFGPQRVFSATELNEYGACPFRFFANRVMQLKPRVEAALDLQSQDRGLLLHEILRAFFASPPGGAPPSGREAALLRMRQAAEDAFERFEKRLPPLNPKLWNIEKSVLTFQLEALLDHEAELGANVARAMRPTFAELAFGMRTPHADPASVREPLTLRHESGETLRLRGQIDRVDVSADGKMLAYDYKSSRGPSLTDMQAGRDVQMAIYLEALETLFAGPDREVIGGGYYALRGGAERRNNGLYRAEYADYTGVGARVRSSLSSEDWTAMRRALIGFVWAYWRRMRDGDFRVLPSQGELTCRFCDFRKACRYERYRIRQKSRRPTNSSI